MAVIQSDVVIVGAGPAGAATAIFLARCGIEVTLLDRAAFPRDKPCGEYLTPGAVGLLRDEIGVLPQLLTAGAVHLTDEIIVPHNGKLFGGRTQALACPRVVTDFVLRQTAEAAGVRVIENVGVRQILFDADRVVGVSDGQDVYRARVTVGADGTHSLLARTLGLVRPVRRLQRIALVGHFVNTRFSELSAVTMHLPADRSDACCGIGISCGLPRSQNVNIVVPNSESQQIAGRLEDYFFERLQRSFPRVWEQVSAARLSCPLRSVGCFGHHTTRAAHDGAVLVGDAATFIHPFTGEGVYFALRGAQLAADAIATALQTGDVSQQTLRAYDAARRRDLLPRYRLCDLVQRIVHSPSMLAWAAERLRRSPFLTEAVLHTVGDLRRPQDLFTLPVLRLALGMS